MGIWRSRWTCRRSRSTRRPSSRRPTPNVASLPDSELERKIQGQIGEYTLGWGITILLCQHEAEHSGEIAALKGVQGLKGLPF